MFLISLLGGVSHFRFKKLLSNSQHQNDAQFITHKMRYFQDLNLLLSVALFLFSTCFIILSADGLTNKKMINQRKFLADFFICNSKYHRLLTANMKLIISCSQHSVYCHLGHCHFDFPPQKDGCGREQQQQQKPSDHTQYGCLHGHE